MAQSDERIAYLDLKRKGLINNEKKKEREFLILKTSEFLQAGGTIKRVEKGMGAPSQLEQEIGYRTYSR